MNCPKCNRELLIDRQDEAGAYWYTCVNPRCEKYHQSFNPISGLETEAKIDALEFDETKDTTPKEELTITE